jgi:hypothetical protein
MSQYSLSYDSSGNASLAATTTTPTRAATPSKDWKVSDYVSRTQDYGVTETFKDKNTPEEQLKTIQKILVPSGNDNNDNNDSNDKNVKKDFSPEFNWKDYTYTEMSKALGVDTANDWVNAYNIEKGASALSTGLGIAGIFTPINAIVKAGAKGTAYAAEKYKEKLVKEYMNSDYYTDKNKMHELEYELTGDYDSYSDINYGPSYGNEYKEGTVFDAEDEENYSTPVAAPEVAGPTYGPHGGGGGGGSTGASDTTGQSTGSSGGYNDGNYCFDPSTLIQMADGSNKKIKNIQLGDNTKGGEVTGVFQFKASDEIHNYKSVTVAGSHYVKEDGRFIMVKDSPLAVKIDKIPVVYSLDTTGRRIFIKDIEFADYNGDGVAKNFLTNAGVKLTGFDTEVLRQVEERLI